MSKLEPTRTYSNHTATDVLRRLLDERGVEYVVDEEYGKKYPPEKRVTWSCDLAGEDMTVTARDYCIGIDDDGSADYFLDLDFHEVFTPEQAIAATLGPAVRHPKPHEKWTTVLLPEIAWSWDDSWPDYLSVAHDTHGEWRVYVPEATLGSCNCSNNCTNSERTETCEADETDTWECVRDDLGGYGKTMTVHVMECTECGHVYEHVNGDYEYCPRCGRKRRDVEE